MHESLINCSNLDDHANAKARMIMSNRYSGITRRERKGSLARGIKVDLVHGNYAMPNGNGAR